MVESIVDYMSMYYAVWPHTDFEQEEVDGIVKEMRAVAAAPTDEEAAEVIRWWRSWETHEEMMRDVRAARRYAKKHNLTGA